MLTAEQEKIVTHVDKTDGLTLISAVAGSGKTTLLKAIAKSVKNSNSLYLAYNSSIATDSRNKFPKSVDCRTVHSLAYRATVKPLNLKVGTFNYRNIEEKLSYDGKLAIIDHIKAFCLSTYVELDDYCSDMAVPAQTKTLIEKYMDRMHTGQIECSHDFYLKLYHIMLHKGLITYQTFDLLLWDEIQDMAPVAACIFELLPANKKIGVGDKYQAIYSFNNTVNYFELAPPNAKTFFMSKSFRVSEEIAKRIHGYCTARLDKDMAFNGHNSQDNYIETSAYITRTNAALIGQMIELNRNNSPYKLIRDPNEIFKIPLMLCGLKYQSFISVPEYRHLQVDIDDWYETTELRLKFTSPLSYIMNLYQKDDQLTQAAKLLLRYGKKEIIEAYNSAKSHLTSKSTHYLCTAHSSKGLEFDEVTIANDLNDLVGNVLIKETALTIQDKELLNLYYVACTRARIRLNNAAHL